MSGIAEATPIPFPRTWRHRPERTVVLPVAEVFAVHNAELIGDEAVVALTVGDAEHLPKRHGLRAPRHRWVRLVAALAREDETLRDELLAELNPRVAKLGGQA